MSYVLGANARNSAIPWLTLYPITQHYTGPHGETGIDIGTPYHTPITFPVGGRVLGAGYYGGGGVVSIGIDLYGQPAALYVQHLDTIAKGIAPGAMVQPGQVVGLSGGQLRGGSHPSSRKYSSGPHTEIGVNAPYGGMWNPYNYGPGYDPIPVLTAMIQGLPVSASGAAAAVQGAVAAAAVKTTTAPGFAPIAQGLQDAQTFVYPSAAINVLQWNFTETLTHNGGVVVARGVIVLAGVALAGALISSMFVERAQQGAELVASAAPFLA